VLGYNEYFHYSIWHPSIAGPFLEAGDPVYILMVNENPDTIQVRYRAFEGFTRPGSDSCSCIWDTTLGDKKHQLNSLETSCSNLLFETPDTLTAGSCHQEMNNPRTSMLC
jgi:hypothetical protein